MEQYISKAAVVAEIERRISVLKTNESVISMLVGGMFVNEFKDLLSFIDSLEVKEVDLEAEYDNYTKHILACDVQFKPFTHLYNCAKYFFELGLKVKEE